MCKSFYMLPISSVLWNCCFTLPINFMTALNNIVPATGVVQLDVLLLVDERPQLVHSLAAALERVQLVGVDVVLVEDLLPLS